MQHNIQTRALQAAAAQARRIQGQVPPGLSALAYSKTAVPLVYPQGAYNQAALMSGHGTFNQPAALPPMSGLHGTFNQPAVLPPGISPDAYNKMLAMQALFYQAQLKGACNQAAPPSDFAQLVNNQEIVHLPGHGQPHNEEEPVIPPDSGQGATASNTPALPVALPPDSDLSFEQGIVSLPEVTTGRLDKGKRKLPGADDEPTAKKRKGRAGSKKKTKVPSAANNDDDYTPSATDEVIQNVEGSTTGTITVDGTSQEKIAGRKPYTRKTGNNEDYSIESLIAQRIAFLSGTLINLPTFLKECGRSGFRLAYIEGIKAGTAMINATTAAAALGLELLKVSASIDPNTTDPALQAMRLTPGEALLIKKKALAAVLRSAPVDSVQNHMQYYHLSPEEDEMITQSLNAPLLSGEDPNPRDQGVSGLGNGSVTIDTQ